MANPVNPPSTAPAPPNGSAGGRTAAARAAKDRRTYHEDVVEWASDEPSPHPNDVAAVVVRSWYDEDDTLWNAPQADGQQLDDLERALRRGEIGVHFYPSASRAIIPESSVRVMDRAFQIGDTVKRDPKSTRSGTVTDVKVKLQLQHVFTKQRLPGWIPASQVQNYMRVSPSDHVIHNDWVGVVEEVFEEALMEVEGESELVRVCDVGAQLAIGATTKIEPDHPIAAMLPELISRSATCVDVKQTVACVNWLGVNQKLPVGEQNQRTRPKRFWPDIDKLTLVNSFTEHGMAVGDQAIFRKPEYASMHGLQPSRHGPDATEVWAVHIVGTHSEVTVLWNDASTSVEEARTLVPYVNISDDDCWPGDYVRTAKAREGPERVGVVQSTDPDERLVKVRWFGGGPAESAGDEDASQADEEVEEVPSLELELHSADPAIVFGARRGDEVLIASSTNGQPLPFLGKIGELEADMPDSEGIRDLLSNVGMQLARLHTRETPRVLPRLGTDADEVDWCGKVVDILPDGDVVVMLPCKRKVTVAVNRLFLLDDGWEDDDGGWGGEDDAETEDEWSEGETPWVSEDGVPIDEDADGWEDDEENGENAESDEEESEEGDTDSDEEVEDASEEVAKPADPPTSVSAGAKERRADDADADAAATNGKLAPSTLGAEAAQSTEPAKSATPGLGPMDVDEASGPSTSRARQQQGAATSSADDLPPWERFAVLEQAPADHHFINEAPTQPKKAFMTRLHREFKILESSLPGSILARTYEDRQDLLRLLIFGPEGTPYADAPFFFDVWLRSTFPQEPPLVHFHSYTNGAGRINPNLYEEGKVCLSLLNTWQGEERTESWSANRSSLLQVAVSIQSLVLVREPYFLEPTFEKLVDTGEGDVNSRLYSERAYVLAQGFVRRALEQPPSGFDEELRQFYFGQRRRLSVLIDRAEKLIEESERARASRNEQRQQQQQQQQQQSPAAETGEKATRSDGVAGAAATESGIAADGDDAATTAGAAASAAADEEAGGRANKRAREEDKEAVERLSGGGVIVLRRTLKVLAKMREERTEDGTAKLSPHAG